MRRRALLSSRPCEATAGRRVTRDVEPDAMRDRLGGLPRATVTFGDSEAVDLVPVRSRCDGGRYRFAVLTADAPNLEGREVVLLMDGGSYWFELRGFSVRGVARREVAAAGSLTWYAVVPGRVLAWDYATIRSG